MNQSPAPTDEELHVLAAAVGALLEARGQHIVTAESCTGGWIAKLFTDIPGSSGWFEGAAVSYGNEAKQAMLGVTAATLDQYGAVSRECALEMVAGALGRLDATIAVAVTGIAGPGGGSPEKPVGSVWLAWMCTDGAAHAELRHFDGDRDAVRRRTVAAALDGVRKLLVETFSR